MTARQAYERTTYLEDIRSLRRRGLTYAEVAFELGISRATVFRILREARS